MSAYIVILGASELQRPLYQAARERGLKAIAVDSRKSHELGQLPDSIVEASPRQPDVCMARLADGWDSNDIIGITTMGINPLNTLAMMREAMNKPGFSTQCARRLTNYLTASTMWAKQQIPTTWSRPVDELKDLENVLRHQPQEKRFSLFPTDSGFCYSKPLLNGLDGKDTTLNLPIDRDGKLGVWILQEVSPLPVIMTETVLFDQKCITPVIAAVTFNTIEQAGIQIQQIDHIAMPLRLQPDVLKALNQVIFDGAMSLGLSQGTITSQLSYDPQQRQFRLLSMQPYCPVGAPWTVAIRESLQVNLHEHLLSEACQIPISPQQVLPRLSQCAIIHYGYNRPDTPITDEVLQNLRQQPGVFQVERITPSQLATHVSPNVVGSAGLWMVVLGDNPKHATQLKLQALANVYGKPAVQA